MKLFFLGALIVMSLVVAGNSAVELLNHSSRDLFISMFSIGIGIFVIVFSSVVMAKELKALKKGSHRISS